MAKTLIFLVSFRAKSSGSYNTSWVIDEAFADEAEANAYAQKSNSENPDFDHKVTQLPLNLKD